MARKANRFNVLACGRRWGKTLLGQDLTAEAALAGGYPCAWFAPTYKFLIAAWRDMDEALAPYVVKRNASDYHLELVSGGVVDMWSLDSGEAGRSRAYKRIIVDEAALVSNLYRAWTTALRPTLADMEGDAWFMSTPRGHNDFWQIYNHGLDPLYVDWTSWQMPTSDNPFIKPEEVEAARRELPDRAFKQEYLAEFMEDGAVFRGVSEAAVAEVQTYKDWNVPHEYVIGCDWGLSEDFSVFCVIDTTLGEQCYMDRSNRIDYLTQVERLKALRQRFSPSVIITENNSQAALMELLRAADLPIVEFNTNNRNKEQIISRLMLSMEQGEIKILNDPVLIGELQAFEVSYTPTGKLRFAAPDGYHDDCVMALALAWSVAQSRLPLRGSDLEVRRAWMPH